MNRESTGSEMNIRMRKRIGSLRELFYRRMRNTGTISGVTERSPVVVCMEKDQMAIHYDFIKVLMSVLS